jgi:putative ABC transport system ATP-binding protein
MSTTNSELIDIKKLWQEHHESKLADLRRNFLGYVLQSGGLLPFLTVEQNIKLPWRIKRMHTTPEHFKKIASRMGIENLFKKKPQYLSGGQRQRIAILRAMVHNPMIILADEPTAAVDTNRAKAIIDDFYGLAKEYDNTIVIVTHNFRLITQLADSMYTYRVSQISETLTRSVCVPFENSQHCR